MNKNWTHVVHKILFVNYIYQIFIDEKQYEEKTMASLICDT